MYLVVYGSDPMCTTPAGNGHVYAAGSGTPTITMGEVTSLSAATTYVTIASGLVTATGTGTPNQRVPCTAIATSGQPARA